MAASNGAGYIQVLGRAAAAFWAGAVTPATLLAVGAVYAGLVLASVYVTELELRLPLLHYRTPYVQVRAIECQHLRRLCPATELVWCRNWIVHATAQRRAAQGCAMLRHTLFC